MIASSPNTTRQGLEKKTSQKSLRTYSKLKNTLEEK